MFVFQRPANVAVFDEQTLTDRSEKLVEDAAFLTSFRFISLASLKIALIIHTKDDRGFIQIALHC